jgi:hypothetical protein
MSASVVRPEPHEIGGPVEDPATGEITHFGLHSTKVVLPGGTVVTLSHGEGVIPGKDGAPAVVLRARKET